MRTYDFTIGIEQFVDDLDAIDAFYARLNDVSMYNANGATKITFHRDAATLDEAVRSAVSDVESFGYTVKQIEIEPVCVGAR